MQARRGFSVENHPFSIAVLTSPARKPPTAGHRAAPVVTAAGVPGHAAPLPFLEAPGLGVPQASPMSSTGSADCSPDTSFSSVSSVALPSSPEALSPPHAIPPGRACSPAASEDSGRGSPYPAEGALRPGTPAGDAREDAEEDAHAQGQQQSEKPAHSYIALISMAILAAPERKLVLADIYQYIMDSFSYYNNQERAWRNSIRHNLSLNECFIKAGRADNGKGNFWAIHPACIDDFSKGDFRRRQARRRARSSANLDQMHAAAMALRCAGYVPMTSSSVGPYHPYLTGTLPGFPAYMSAASYPSVYAPAFSAPPPSASSGTRLQSPPVSLPHADHQTPAFAPSAHALMAAYGSLCAGQRPTLTSGHVTPTAGAASMVAATTTPPYSQQRYSPYGRIPTQILW